MRQAVNFEDDELMVMAIYAARSRTETIQTMREAMEVLADEPRDITAEEMMELIRNTIEKLEQIEDEYFYSLDMNAYLYEEDADEN